MGGNKERLFGKSKPKRQRILKKKLDQQRVQVARGKPFVQKGMGNREGREGK